MTEDMFESWLDSHHYTFINFYAPWCLWCQRLEPVWEAFAEKVEEEDLPVSIVRVDCIANKDLCMKLKIQVNITKTASSISMDGSSSMIKLHSTAR